MLPIGTLAKRTGTTLQAIRYYEQIGFLPEPGRTEGGQRRYLEGDLDRLAFIRHARHLGFTLEAIRELLDLSDNPGQSCADVDRTVQHQLKEVEARITRLEPLRRNSGACSGNAAATPSPTAGFSKSCGIMSPA
jgi:DNA-binding transcriptional MerR regulator